MGKVGAHGIAVRGDLGLLTGNGAVGIDKLKAQIARIVHHASEQHHRVGALIGGIGVGEELADVSPAAGAQNSVGQGVREHIGIRVAQQAALVGNVDPADDASTPLHQTVDVVAVANAQVTEHGGGPLPRPCGRAKSRLRDAGPRAPSP